MMQHNQQKLEANKTEKNGREGKEERRKSGRGGRRQEDTNIHYFIHQNPPTTVQKYA
jgi:hypothetical protein